MNTAHGCYPKLCSVLANTEWEGILNLVIFMGRLTKDPEVRYTSGPEQKAVARMSIAVDRRFKRDNQPDADFFYFAAFGKIAEFAEKYLKKGTKIVLQGHVQNNNYKDQQGNTVYSNQIIADSIEFAESKRAAEGGQYQQTQNATDPDGFMNIPDAMEDELPFN